MKTRVLVLVIATVWSVSLARSAPPLRAVKVYVQGDTNSLAYFVEAGQREFAKRGLDFQEVPFEGDFEYNVVIAREVFYKQATASIVVLDRKGLLVATVIHSGSMSEKGAFNAAATELAKKMAVLVQR